MKLDPAFKHRFRDEWIERSSDDVVWERTIDRVAGAIDGPISVIGNS